MNINVTVSKQSYLFCPTMNFYLDGQAVAWLGNGEKTSLSAPAGTHELQTKASLRSKTIKFTASKDVSITTRWNRISGKIEMLCTGEDVKIY